MQEPLRRELINGVENLKKDIADFDIDFEENGPMVEGLPAKEASERYFLKLFTYIINKFLYLSVQTDFVN